MELIDDTRQKIAAAVNPQRMIELATQLIAVPSPTGDAGAVSNKLAELLSADGFRIERHDASHKASPAVVVRMESGSPGKTLQIDGHLDTVHLPFVAPAVDGDNLTGSGACDMKGGLAAAVEAMRALRDSGLFRQGSVLLTAHDLHEAPWGRGEQLDELIRQNIVGDAVLIPEPLTDHLPVKGRGAATWKIVIRRAGPPVHEVMRPADEPSVIDAGMKVVQALTGLNMSLSKKTDPLAGSESVFIGQIHSGEIYNQFPQECWLQGTRRWLPGSTKEQVEAEFRRLLDGLQRMTKTSIDLDFQLIRGAFQLDETAPIFDSFQQACSLVRGETLPTGAKAFVDDGNSFWSIADIPAITHGPRSGGQHTVNEWMSISDMERVAQIYALTALRFC